MAPTQITFGVEEQQARAHAEAPDQVLGDTVATKQDVREEATRLQHQIEIAVRDLKIWMGELSSLSSAPSPPSGTLVECAPASFRSRDKPTWMFP